MKISNQYRQCDCGAVIDKSSECQYHSKPSSASFPNGAVVIPPKAVEQVSALNPTAPVAVPIGPVPDVADTVISPPKQEPGQGNGSNGAGVVALKHRKGREHKSGMAREMCPSSPQQTIPALVAEVVQADGGKGLIKLGFGQVSPSPSASELRKGVARMSEQAAPAAGNSSRVERLADADPVGSGRSEEVVGSNPTSQSSDSSEPAIVENIGSLPIPSGGVPAGAAPTILPISLAQIDETAYTPAEANILHIAQLIRGAKRDILTIAQLLCVNQDNAFWSVAKYESFQNYVESLGLGYSWTTRMMGVVRLLASKQLTAPDVDEMGLANAGTLVAVARHRNLTIEDISAAKGPCRDLRLYLGHTLPEVDREVHINCPRCGIEIKGAKWVTKDKEQLDNLPRK